MPQTPRASTRNQLGVELEDPRVVETDPELEVEEQVEEEVPARPEWLLDKFTSVEEQARGYAEAERRMQQQAEAQRRMEAQLDQLTEMVSQPQQQAQPQEMGPDALREQLSVAFENDPIGTMAYLAQQYANQTIDQRLQAIQQENNPAIAQQVEQQNQLLAMTVDRALGDQYQDWNEYKERVATEIEQDPTLLPQEMLQSPELTMRQLSRIYENLKARDVLAQAQNGNFVSNELNQMKRQAQTISGQGARPGEPNADDEHFARLMAAAKGMSYASWRET